MRKTILLVVSAPILGLLLAGCEQLGLETPAQVSAAKEAEGRAVGSACRHSGRALEDCYTLNPKAQKAAVFSGWRDMDAYMRENSLEVIAPVIPRPDTAKKKKPVAEAEAVAPATKGEKAEEAPAKKEGAAHSAVERPLPAPAAGGRMV